MAVQYREVMKFRTHRKGRMPEAMITGARVTMEDGQTKDFSRQDTIKFREKHMITSDLVYLEYDTETSTVGEQLTEADFEQSKRDYVAALTPPQKLSLRAVECIKGLDGLADAIKKMAVLIALMPDKVEEDKNPDEYRRLMKKGDDIIKRVEVFIEEMKEYT
jgi:hypothetical protein